MESVIDRKYMLNNVTNEQLCTVICLLTLYNVLSSFIIVIHLLVVPIYLIQINANVSQQDRT